MIHGIGEYVHAREENYKKFGLGRSRRRGLSFMQAYNQAHNELLGRISATSTKLDLVDLETTFNNLYKGLTTNVKNMHSNQGQITDALDYYFVEQVNAYFAKKSHTINYDTLEVNSLGEIFSKAIMQYNKRSKGKGTPYFKSETWEKFRTKINDLKQQLEDLLKQGIINKNTWSTISQKLSVIESSAYHCWKSIQNHNGSVEDLRKKYSGMRSLMDEYNALVRAYSAPSKKELGDIGEFVAHYLALRAAGTAKIETRRLVQENLINPTSAKRSSTAYDFAGFVTEEALAKLPSYTSKRSAGRRTLSVSLNGSQDTIDIISEFADGPLRASVKNVSNINHWRGIHVLSGMPLTALFNLVNTDFVNHYMNLLAFKREDDIKKANNIWERAVAVRALAGARTYYGTKLANTFIVYDRKKKHFHLFSVSALLKRILSGHKDISNYLKVTGDGFPPTQIPNDWVGSPQVNSYKDAGVRIGNIFTKLHAVKLKASLLPAALK